VQQAAAQLPSGYAALLKDIKVIDRLSRGLAHEFPDRRGFSPRNLLFMRVFADGYADETIVKQLVSLSPWDHDVWATANCAGGACTIAVGHNVRVQQIEAELARGAKPPPAPKKKPIRFRPEGR
jgi:hypothetical protein